MTRKKPRKVQPRISALLLTAMLAFAAPSFGAVERHIVLDDCVVGGCSNQLCNEASAAPVASTCEYTPQYACYPANGECKRQTDGKCGWTPSKALAACILNPPKEAGTTAPKPFVTPQPPSVTK